MNQETDLFAVTLSIYILNKDKHLCTCMNDVDDIKLQLMEDIQVLSDSYLWYEDCVFLHTDSFQSSKNVISTKTYYYLKATINVGDGIEDEWMIAYIAQKLSEKYASIIIHLEDGDGDYLLIEAAQTLPKWVDPSTMQNRFYLYQGHYHIIPHPYYSDYSNIPLFPSIEESISLLLTIPCQVSSSIEDCILNRIQKSKKESLSHNHTFNCLLPLSWSHIIKINSIIRLFARLYIESPSIEKQQVTKAFQTLPVPDDLTLFTIQLPKLLFLRLISCCDESSEAASRDKYLTLTPKERWLTIGNCLRKGALLWKQPVENKQGKENQIESIELKKNSILDKDMIYALINNYSYEEYCQLKESRIPSLMEKTPLNENQGNVIQEDLTWLTIKEEDLQELLRNEEGNIRDEDIDDIIKQEQVEEEVLQSFKGFLSSISNVEGIDSIVENQEHEVPSNTVVEHEDVMNVNFDTVMDLLEGFDIKVDSENEHDNQEDEEVKQIMKDTKEEIRENNADELFNEEDMDFDVINNLLKSYSLQPTVDGPVSNIMTSMGKTLPPVDKQEL